MNTLETLVVHLYKCDKNVNVLKEDFCIFNNIKDFLSASNNITQKDYMLEAVQSYMGKHPRLNQYIKLGTRKEIQRISGGFGTDIRYIATEVCSDFVFLDPAVKIINEIRGMTEERAFISFWCTQLEQHETKRERLYLKLFILLEAYGLLVEDHWELTKKELFDLLKMLLLVEQNKYSDAFKILTSQFRLGANVSNLPPQNILNYIATQIGEDNIQPHLELSDSERLNCIV